MLLPLFSLLLAVAGPGAQCDAQRTYASVRETMSGARWNGIAEIVASGTVTTSGLQGTFARATDLTNGRSALRMTVDGQQTANVYNGTTNWQQDYSRGIHPLDSPNARAAAVAAAYLDRNGPWASAAGATIECLGTRTEGGRTFAAFKITPPGGTPVEQWIDITTHLVDRTIAETPTSTEITTFANYRNVQGVLVPFRVQTETVGDPTSVTVFSTQSVELRPQARDEDFRRPADPTDTRILGTSDTVTMPISIEGGDVIVNAYVNGKGPFPFILDTGGHAILTPEAARAIGLETEGAGSSGGGGSGRVGLAYTHVDSLRIGDAEIPNQPFLVIPYDNDFSDRGSKPPLAGILGLELFERFAIRIDYAGSKLTLTPLATFQYAGSGTRAPIVFQEDEPLTNAAADDA
ncbi:MAG: retropepsin-like aspartic protease, partial [Candidatus Baltobacteraceae bacterium]